jgi:uncharacterized membrane protein
VQPPRDAVRVLLAGESWVVQTTHIKGVDYFTQCSYGEGARWLRRAIEGGGNELRHLPSHLAPEQFPASADELSEYDVLILSDIGANTLLLHPDTTAHSTATPNRLVAIRDYVAAGGGLLMIGGYMSFQGIDGKARYHATPVGEALPVRMLRGVDDRVEVPEGFRPRVVDGAGGHPILAGIPAELPLMLFYNQIEAKPEAEVLLSRGEDPILAVWEFGRGRAAAFAPDAAPHGAPPEFLDWELFDLFWQQLVGWLGRATPVTR